MIDNKVEDIKKHVECIMDILNIERTQSNENTPLRVAKMWANEVFANRNDFNKDKLDSQMATFEAESQDTIMVEVPFSSMCEHHWMPFMGKVTISYIPKDIILGMSKFARIVDYYSNRPQLQERLTKDICYYLGELLSPITLSVRIECSHTCVACRGIKKRDMITTTICKWEGA